MKGIIFTEFLDMVEQRFSPQVVEQMVTAAQLPSGGAYTSVGKYDHGEIWSLVCELSKVCDTSVPELFKAYGEYLFARLATGYPQLIAGMGCAFDVLVALDGVIHGEVRRLYPDAELPRFDVVERSADRMVLVYSSKRHFADLAEGLIRGCLAHFHENAAISREQLSAEDGSRVRFRLALQ
jgi:Haem-NO-binding